MPAFILSPERKTEATGYKEIFSPVKSTSPQRYNFPAKHLYHRKRKMRREQASVRKRVFEDVR
jgi:hypothetical protein